MKKNKNTLKNKIMMSAAIGTGVAMLVPGSLAFAETPQAHNMIKHNIQHQQVSKVKVEKNQQLEGIVNFAGGPFTYVTSRPDWNNSGVGKLYNGTPVKITGQTNGWYKIDFNGSSAWICKDRVETFKVTPLDKSGIVDFSGGQFTYITSKPNWNNSGVGELYNGSPVRITGESGDWYQIQYNGSSAWICKDRVNTEAIKTLNKTGVVAFTGGPFTYITSKPDWNNSGVGQLYNGTPVNITGEYGNWYRIDFNGNSAWICKDRVNTNVKTPYKTISEKGIVNFIGGPFTYITSRPNWDNSGVGELNNGTPLNITAEYGNWYKIDYNGGSAWICKDRVLLNSSIKTIDANGVIKVKEGGRSYVYEVPNLENGCMEQLLNGQTVQITGEHGNWYRITWFEGQSAWILKNTVEITQQVQNVNLKGVVDFKGGTFTYITSRPNWNNSGVGALNNGTAVTITGETANWYRIDHNGGSAWICKDRVNLEKEPVKVTPVKPNSKVTTGTQKKKTETTPSKKVENKDQSKTSESNKVEKEQSNTKTGIVDFKGGTFTYITRNPNWNNDGVAALNNGTKVTIIGESGSWYKIEYKGGSAWICKDRVNLENTTKVTPAKTTGTKKIENKNQSKTTEGNKVEKEQSNTKTGIVDFKGGTFTYITRNPNWNNDGVAALNNGTKVTIIGESGSWYKIEYKGGSAWICKDRVNLEKEPVKVTPAKPTDTHKAIENNKNKTEVTPTKGKTEATPSKKVENKGQSKTTATQNKGTATKSDSKVTTENHKDKAEVTPAKTGAQNGKTESKGNTEVANKDQSKTTATQNKGTEAKPDSKVTTENHKDKAEVTPAKTGAQKDKTEAAPTKKVENNTQQMKKLNETGTIDYKDGTTTFIMSNTSWKSSSVCKISNGSKVKIIGQEGNWYKVEYNNKTGWITNDRVINVEKITETATDNTKKVDVKTPDNQQKKDNGSKTTTSNTTKTTSAENVNSKDK